MAWYYMDDEQEIGPVGKTELQQLFKAGIITGDTSVRTEDSDQWRNLSDYFSKKKTATPSPSATPPPAPGASPTPPAMPIEDEGATAVCSQCGRSAPKDQVLTYENKIICAACKPMFVQRLREGAKIATDMNYAGFWIRFVAKFIDGILMAITQWAVMIPLGILAAPASMTNGDGPSSGLVGFMLLQQVIGIGIPAVYTTFFLGRYGATLGKMACRLKVVQPEGDKVSYWRALGRNFAEMISGIILLIGYIMAAFDDEKRALHDRICSTRVVYK